MSRVRDHAALAGLPDLCLLMLRLAGWATVTLLAAAGCLVLFFAMLGGFTAQGFFAHLANLATRFGAADPHRRDAFLALARLVGAAAVAVIAACRWRSLARSFTPVEASRHD